MEVRELSAAAVRRSWEAARSAAEVAVLEARTSNFRFITTEEGSSRAVNLTKLLFDAGGAARSKIGFQGQPSTQGSN